MNHNPNIVRKIWRKRTNGRNHTSEEILRLDKQHRNEVGGRWKVGLFYNIGT